MRLSDDDVFGPAPAGGRRLTDDDIFGGAPDAGGGRLGDGDVFGQSPDLAPPAPAAEPPGMLARGARFGLERGIDTALTFGRYAEQARDFPSRFMQGFSGAYSSAMKGAPTLAQSAAMRHINLPRDLLADMPSPQDSPIYQAGQALEDFTRETFPTDPRFDDDLASETAGALGSFTGFMIPGGAAGLATRGALRAQGYGLGIQRAGQQAAQFGTAAPIAATAGAEEAYARAMDFAQKNPEFGLTEADAVWLAPYGAAGGLVQIASLAPIFRFIPNEHKAQSMAYLLRRMAEAGVSEWTVENAGAVIQNLTEQTYNPDQETFEDVPDRGNPAGIAGALMQAILFPGIPTVSGRRTRSGAIPSREEVEDLWRRADQPPTDGDAVDVPPTDRVLPALPPPRFDVTPEGVAARPQDLEAERARQAQEREALGMTPDVEQAGLRHPGSPLTHRVMGWTEDGRPIMGTRAPDSSAGIPDPSTQSEAPAAPSPAGMTLPGSTEARTAQATPAEGEGVPADPTTPAARARMYEDLAAQATDPGVKNDLLRQAEIYRSESHGEPVKMTPRERARRTRIVDPSKDDLVTAIRRLGGIDTDIESDWVGRLKHLNDANREFGLPFIERPGQGRSLDELAELLMDYGYLQEKDAGRLAEMLWDAEDGTKIFSLLIEGQQLEREMESRMESLPDADEMADVTGRDEALSSYEEMAQDAPVEEIDGVQASGLLSMIEAEAEAVDSGAVEAILERAAIQGLSEAEIAAQLIEVIRRPNQDASEEHRGSPAEPSSRAQGPRGASAEIEPGIPPQTRSGSEITGLTDTTASQEAPLTLETQTEESLRARAEAERRREAEEAERRRQEEQRAQADRDRAGFTLTGSSRPADVAMSHGQRDLIGAAQQRRTGAVQAAAAQTDTNPTDAQKEAGNYRKGSVRLHGLDISIENPRGSERSGTDRDGRAWTSTMAHHYGYIRKTEGKDGDHIDVFLGPQAEDASMPAFIVDQVNPRSRRFDEHKIMMGFPDEASAREGYLANYQDGWQGLGGITEVSLEDLKQWLREGDTTRRFSPAGGLQSQEDSALYSGYERNPGDIRGQRRDSGRVSEPSPDGGRPGVQGDLFTRLPSEEPAARAQLGDNFLVRYKQAPVGEVRVGVEFVRSPEDAAHVFAPFRKQAQEVMLVLAVDKDGRPLSVIHVAKGQKDGTSVDPTIIASAVAATKDAAGYWLAHNHPSGVPEPSMADIRITRKITETFEGSGIKTLGHIILARGTAASVLRSGQIESDLIKIKPFPRKKSVPVTERVIRKQPPTGLRAITGPETTREILQEMQLRNGILLLDTRHRPAGVMALTTQEMSTLREGGRVRRILSALDTTNASAAIVVSESEASARNVARYLNHIGNVRVLDAMIHEDGGQMRSSAETGGGVESSSGPWFSRRTSPETRSAGVAAAADPPMSVFSDAAELKKHKDYAAAKSGDVDAAIRLVRDLVDANMLSEAKRRFDSGTVFVAPMAMEQSGENAIPRVLAERLAQHVGGRVHDGIVQVNRVFHTGANAMERLVARPRFDGPVEASEKYVIVDDVITLGGTLAEMANHIQKRGGKVVGVVTLANASRSGRMAPSEKIVRDLERRFGDEIRKIFGVEPDALTADEAGYLIGFRDADALRSRAAKARAENARRRSAKGVPDDPVASRSPTRETRPSAGFSASGGRKSQAQTLIAAITGQWKNAPKVHVLNDMGDAPESVRQANEKALSEGDVGDAEAFYYRGEVYIVLDGLEQRPGESFAEALFRVLAHEALGHAGLRGLFGADLTPVLRQIAAFRRKDVAAKARKYGYAATIGDARDAVLREARESGKKIDRKALEAKARERLESDTLRAAEEVLAEMAESTPNVGFVRRAVEAIRQALRKLYMRLPASVKKALGQSGFLKWVSGMSDAEIIQNYIVPARRFVQEGRSGEGAGAASPAFSRAPAVDSDAFRRWFGDSKVVDADGKPLVVYHSTNADWAVFDGKQTLSSFGFHAGTKEQADAVRETGGTKHDVEARRPLDGMNFMPVYLSIQNPLRMADSGVWYPFEMVDALEKLGIKDESRLPVDAREKAGFGASHMEVTWENKSRARKLYDFKIRQEIDAWRKDHPDANRDAYENQIRIIGRDYVLGLIEGAGYDGIVYDNKYEGGGDSYIAFRPEQIKSAIGNRGTFDPNNPDIRFSRRETPKPDPEPSEAKQRQESFLKAILSQPIDRAFRAPFDVFGLVDSTGRFKGGTKVAEAVRKVLVEAKPADGGRFGWMNQMLETARAGIVDRYRLSNEYKRLWGKRESEERAIVMKGIDTLKDLEAAGVDSSEAKVLQAILNGETIPDAEWKKLSDPIRAAVDEMGQEAVMLGLISAETYERNKGSYLHRVYLKHESRDAGLGRWMRRALDRRRRAIIGNATKRRGIDQPVTMSQLQRHAPDEWWGRKMKEGAADKALANTEWLMLQRVEQAGEGVAPLPGLEEGGGPRRIKETIYWPADESLPARYETWENKGRFKVIDVRGNKAMLWRDYTKAERENMGEILDARYTIARTYQELGHDLATGRFFKDVAQNPEWSVEAPQPGDEVATPSEYSRMRMHVGVDWVKVPDVTIERSGAKKWGMLSGRYIRPEIWRDLNELDRMRTQGSWRKLLNQWKINKTARSPVVHMNNVMSNLVLMDLADVRATDLIEGLRSYVKGDQHYQDALEHGAFEGGYVLRELNKQVLDPLLEQIAKEAMAGNSIETTANVLSRMLYGLAAAVKKADRKMVEVYQIEDEVFRMATYMRRLALGDPPDVAAHIAKEQFLNYDIRAPWINALRGSVLPFISYTYRAVPVVAQSIAERPWKIAKYATLAYLANLLAYEIAPGDEDEERRTMRDQEQGYTWIGTPRMLRMPYRDDNGNPVFLDIRRWIPAGDIFDMQQGQSAIPIPAPLQFGGPMMLGAELFLNKQAFTGQQIINPNTDDAWDRTRNISSWAWKSWMPSAAWIPGSWYWDAIWRAAEGGRDPLGRPYSVAQAASSSVGVKLKPHDVQMGYRFRSMELQQQRRALQFELRRLEQDRERGLINLDTYERERDRTVRKMERLKERADQLMTGGD